MTDDGFRNQQSTIKHPNIYILTNMPYGIRKLTRKPNCFKVFNKKTKKIFSKCSTNENAKKQLKLLRAIRYNKKFVPYGRRNTRKNT
jgi:hypothetical protein